MTLLDNHNKPLARLRAFIRGMREFRLDCTWADPLRKCGYMTDLDYAYDSGREWAHRLTFRLFER